jgi:glycosyltransferase involved in cell wall biosynthesis
MKISVVIPTINHAHWLPESIESALNQTLKPHEVIVVDIAGGSEDNTKEVVALYPVRYLVQPHRGVSDARNHGIRNSSGDWIAFLDSDDYWLPRRLELQAAAIKDEAFGYCATTRFYQDGHTEDMEYYDVPKALSVLRHHNFIDTSAGMVRRDAMERIGGFNQESCAGEEWEAWLKLARYYKFVGIPDRLLMYRVTGAGLSVNPETVLRSMDFIVSAASSHLPALERFVVGNRMRSVRTTLAALKYRDRGDYSNCLKYAFRAFAYWPSPFYDKAFKVIALELRRRLTGKNAVAETGRINP